MSGGSLRTGKITPAVPRTEASKNRYYELPEEIIGEFQPEKLLAQIESQAASAIAGLESGGPGSTEQVMWLALFALLQWARTPIGRRQRKALDEVMERQMVELRLSAKEKVIEFIREHEPGLSVEEAEQQRLELFDDLQSGRIVFESTPEREVASMFLALPQSAEELVAKCDWTLVRFPEGSPLVLPDTGITRCDPSPKIPGTSSGFLGSPTVENAIHLSSHSALLITPGSGVVFQREGEDEDVAEFNLRAYASSDVCLYGQDQEVLKALRQFAKKHPAELLKRRPIAPTLWISEGDESATPDQPVRFTGYSVDGTRTQELYIDPKAQRGKGVRPDDLW